MGWGLVSERNSGCRYSSEGRSFASFESLECQNSRTLIRQSDPTLIELLITDRLTVYRHRNVPLPHLLYTDRVNLH